MARPSRPWTAQAPACARNARPVSTYSIVACDLGGRWGVATQSKFLAVGSVVPWAAPQVGAIATQSYANPRYGPDGLELLRPVEVRRAGDRDLVVGEVRHHPSDRQRLERLRGAAQIRDERGVAARLDDLPVENRDRVNVMPGFDGVAASCLDDDPLHGW